jgi:hypothetical protein
MSTLVAQTLSNGTVSTSTANCIQGSAKAWLKCNSSTGSVVVNASYNISSITRQSAGNYTVFFTNAMSDTNFCVVGTVQYNGIFTVNTPPVSASSVVITAAGTSGSGFDSNFISLAVFR